MDPAYEYKFSSYASDSNKVNTYLKIAIVSVAITVAVALLIYWVKPDVFLVVKGDKDSGLQTSTFIPVCIAVFIISFIIVYFVYQSFENSHGQYSPAPYASPTAMHTE